MKIRSIVCGGFLLLALNACGYRIEKEPEKPTTNIASGQIGYAEVQALVLQPKCATCHAWGGSDKFDLVFQRKDEIQARVSSGNMPAANSPTGSLTASEKEILLSWIARGAPRESTSLPPSTPPGSTPPGSPPSPCSINVNDPNDPCIGFAEVKSKVLQPKCATCHAFPETYLKTFAKISMIQSRVSNGVMPPSSSMPLDDFEKSMLLSWITRGAPEFGSKNQNPTPTPPTPKPPCECLRGGDDCNDEQTSDRHNDDCLK